MMPEGNRYAAAMDPSMAGQPQGGAPPPDAGPPQGQPPGPPQDQGAQSPALAEAIQVLSGHDGPIADLLKDPTKLQHIKVVLVAVKQDPSALQALQKMGIGPQQLQQFEQMVQQAEQGGQGGGRDDSGRPVPHWLTR